MDSNKKLILSIFWIILGAVLFAVSCMGILDASIYSGLGGGLIAVGILQIIRYIRCRNNKAYREKLDIEVNDERNKLISTKSWAWTGYTMLLLFGIGAIVSLIMGQSLIQMVFIFSICAMVCVYWISYIILNKKY